MECTVCFIGPGSTAVVGEQHKGIKLILGQGKTVLIHNLYVNITLYTCQMVTKQGFCFCLCDTILGIVFNHIVGTPGTVTYGILGKIPIRCSAEAFFGFQDT